MSRGAYQKRKTFLGCPRTQRKLVFLCTEKIVVFSRESSFSVTFCEQGTAQ